MDVLPQGRPHAQVAWADLPPALIARLAAEGIHGPDDWRRLTRHQRRSIWGVSRFRVAQIDRLVRGAS
jgi:hypothetical protein